MIVLLFILKILKIPLQAIRCNLESVANLKTLLESQYAQSNMLIKYVITFIMEEDTFLMIFNTFNINLYFGPFIYEYNLPFL